MILSMTGFGKASIISKGMQYEVVIRTLNSKQLEISMRTAFHFRECETKLRSLISSYIQRGRVDYTLNVTPIAEDSVEEEVSKFFDEERLLGLYNAIHHFRQKHHISDSDQAFARILGFSGIAKPLQDKDNDKLTEEEVDLVMQLTMETLDNLNQFRIQEGEMLATTLQQNIENIERGRLSVQAIAPTRIESINTKLRELLDELPQTIEIDKGRLEQEMVYYIEKLDINEELTRLENHLKYFNKTISDGTPQQPVGKKLGFIAQEMGREINTMGSKSNETKMQHLVVEMKDLLEQIKEHVANVL